MLSLVAAEEDEDEEEEEEDDDEAAMYGIDVESPTHIAGTYSDSFSATVSVICPSDDVVGDRASLSSQSALSDVDSDDAGMEDVAELPLHGAWRLANLVDKVIRAGVLARQVRGLRAAAHDARRQCRTASRNRSALLGAYQKARAKSAAVTMDYNKLCLLVREREQQLASNKAHTRGLEEAAAFERAGTSPVFEELRHAQMRREAQRVVFLATMAAVAQLPMQAAPGSPGAQGRPAVAEESAWDNVDEEEDDQENEEDKEDADDLNDAPPETLSKQPLLQRESSSSWILRIPCVEPPSQPGRISRGLSWTEKLPDLRASTDSMVVVRHNGITADDGDVEADPPSRKRSALFIEDFSPVRQPSQSSSSFCATASDPLKNTSFTQLRAWLSNAPVPIASIDTTHTERRKAAAEKAPAATPAPPELRELLTYIQAAYPELGTVVVEEEHADDAPDLERCGRLLVAEELARILRLGVASEVVSAQALAIHLSRKDEGQLRQAYFGLCIQAWLGPYLEARQQELGFGSSPQPESWTRTFFQNPLQRFARMCGRLLVDAMRELFCRAMMLRGVEQEGIVRLLEDFAHALADEEEVQNRFAYVLVPEADMPKDVTSLEHVLFLLVYHGLLLNTALNNPAAKRKTQTKQEFAMQGYNMVGVQLDCCRKIYDLIRATPLS